MRLLSRTLLFALLATACLALAAASPSRGGLADDAGGAYTLVIEGFDWGPAVSKVIVHLDASVSEAEAADFAVSATRRQGETPLGAGERRVVFAYVSDEAGMRQAEGRYIALVLEVAPNLPIGSPIQYQRGRGNDWIDYELEVTQRSTGMSWDQEAGRVLPLIEEYDRTGTYAHDEDLTLSYAFYRPERAEGGPTPLIIWLHGGGEGGTDPTIPLIANRAANYAAPEIQAYFGGAYVLVPQCPGAWMHNQEGVSTRGRENDMYNEGLMALIRNFVAEHPDIDPDRIYVGGCSNGGYMALKLVLLYPDYFAAAFPSALAYRSQYISDAQIESIADVPMWFIHSADDPTTVAANTAVPVYERLIAAGAKNVHFSFYDHVYDITGFFGGEGYRYPGHWSWIYSHANHARLDYDGTPVMLDGRQVTIMEWLAAQRRGN